MIRGVSMSDPKQHDLVGATLEKPVLALFRRTKSVPDRVAPPSRRCRVRKWLIGAICTALVAVPKETLAFQDGNHLLDWATSDDIALEGAFMMYVIGVRDALENIWDYTGFDPQLKFCTSGSTSGDIRDAVRIWMRRNPEELDHHPLVVVTSALRAHFPCDGRADDEGR